MRAGAVPPRYGGRRACGARHLLYTEHLSLRYTMVCILPRWYVSKTACAHLSIQEQLLHRIVKRFRAGLVFKARRRVYHSTLGSRVMKKKNDAHLSDTEDGEHVGGGSRFTIHTSPFGEYLQNGIYPKRHMCTSPIRSTVSVWGEAVALQPIPLPAVYDGTYTAKMVYFQNGTPPWSRFEGKPQVNLPQMPPL